MNCLKLDSNFHHQTPLKYVQILHQPTLNKYVYHIISISFAIREYAAWYDLRTIGFYTGTMYIAWYDFRTIAFQKVHAWYYIMTIYIWNAYCLL